MQRVRRWLLWLSLLFLLMINYLLWCCCCVFCNEWRTQHCIACKGSCFWCCFVAANFLTLFATYLCDSHGVGKLWQMSVPQLVCYGSLLSNYLCSPHWFQQILLYWTGDVARSRKSCGQVGISSTYCDFYVTLLASLAEEERCRQRDRPMRSITCKYNKLVTDNKTLLDETYKILKYIIT